MIKERPNEIDWTEGSDMDPRLPTDPDYVEATALQKELGINYDDLMEYAGKHPKNARCAAGNPWTPSMREKLFLNQHAVQEHFSS